MLILPYYAMVSCLAWGLKAQKSAVGTILLHSPGWNEGKARYGTLGKHRQKRIELRRSGTNSTSVGAFALGLCRPYGAQ